MPGRNIIPLFFFIILLCGPICSFSQTKQIDSLKLVLINSKEDSNKVKTLLELSKRFHSYKTILSDIAYADTALKLAKKIKYVSGEFKALNRIGSAVLLNNDHKQALLYYSDALALAEELGNKKMLAEVYGYIGYAYTTQDNYPEAFNYNFKALKLDEESGDKYKAAKIWLSIGTFYTNLDNQPEALNSYTMALKLFKESPETERRDIAACYHFMGRSNLLQGNYTKAIGLFQAALKIWIEIDRKSFIAGTTSQIGSVYKALGDSIRNAGNANNADKMYKEAMKNFYTALHIAEKSEDIEGIASEYKNIADMHIIFKEFLQAGSYLNKALILTKSRTSKQSFQDIYQSLSTLDSATGDYSSAYTHYQLYIKYHDSIRNEEAAKKIEQYKMQFVFDKKEDSLKQKQLLTETKLHTEKKQNYFYLAGITLLAILSLLVYRNLQNQKKINRLAADAYANERAELELQSLRAQLNPHFIFNCINSIDAFIHSNDKYNATVYLNKFARLLRNILDSSKLNTVSFTKDIDTLKLYVELEELRHENKFRSVLNIQDELLSNDYKVPALIIQPFVENAILHGLKNREDNNGLLQIEIRKTDDKIEYRIKDNGIGRKAAGLIAQNKESSYGMQMSYDRIKLFNKEEKASVEIIDLYKDSIAAGTEVKVLLNII